MYNLHSNLILVFEVIESSSTLSGPTQSMGHGDHSRSPFVSIIYWIGPILDERNKYYLWCAKGGEGEINVNFG
jgi:hypothetical protein